MDTTPRSRLHLLAGVLLSACGMLILLAGLVSDPPAIPTSAVRAQGQSIEPAGAVTPVSPAPREAPLGEWPGKRVSVWSDGQAMAFDTDETRGSMLPGEAGSVRHASSTPVTNTTTCRRTLQDFFTVRVTVRNGHVISPCPRSNAPHQRGAG